MIRHVAIVGVGNVGATVAYTLVTAGLVEQISLIDIDTARAEGEALDLMDGVSFLRPTVIRSGGYNLCRDAMVVVITAGVNQKPGQSRMDLLQQNASVYRSVIPAIVGQTTRAVLLVVTNPVDPLTYLALKLSGLPPGQVLGSGTVLDTARLRSRISAHCRIDPRNIHGYVIGPHGEDAVPLWSSAQIAGMRLERYCRFCGKGCSARDEIGHLVKTAADRIIAGKGATYYAVALAVKRIVESILSDENSMLTVSTLLTGQYGIDDVCLSLPAVVNSQGVADVLPPELDWEEENALRQSAAMLKKAQELISPDRATVPAPI